MQCFSFYFFAMRSLLFHLFASVNNNIPGSDPLRSLDIFNVSSGVWTVANLSEARFLLSAVSLPRDGVAIFAGGRSAFLAVSYYYFK